MYCLRFSIFNPTVNHRVISVLFKLGYGVFICKYFHALSFNQIVIWKLYFSFPPSVLLPKKIIFKSDKKAFRMELNFNSEYRICNFWSIWIFGEISTGTVGKMRADEICLILWPIVAVSRYTFSLLHNQYHLIEFMKLSLSRSRLVYCRHEMDFYDSHFPGTDVYYMFSNVRGLYNKHSLTYSTSLVKV